MYFCIQSYVFCNNQNYNILIFEIKYFFNNKNVLKRCKIITIMQLLIKKRDSANTLSIFAVDSK